MNYVCEVIAVEALAQKIGYGNLMDITGNLWALSLERQGYPANGAFYPVCECNIKGKKIRNRLIKDRKREITRLRNIGIVKDAQDDA